ncbi:MAG: lipopolysaccharide biosynthesis protein [Muribaculum sp.]|nr:lipopolysaccharide biosynthesis protein [Muribaculum sp.]
MAESLGKKAVRGALWSSFNKVGYMALQFVVNLVLARLLAPAEFGIIGMLMIFIAVSQVLVDGGFASALIQKKDADQTDFSTIFYWNIVFSIFIYIILYAGAPWVGNYFHMPQLCGVLRWMGITLIFSGMVSVQMARLKKNLQFKQLAMCNLLGYIVGATAAIVMAWIGMGVWSLVAMMVLSNAVNILLILILTRWWPSREFSTDSLRQLFGYGGFMLGAQLLQEFCKNMQGLIIGRRYSAAQMGYYSQAQKLNQISSYTLPKMIVEVMYPVYSGLQDDRPRLASVMEMNIRVISFMMFPIFGLLIYAAEPIITILYGSQWLPAVPFYRIFCIGGLAVCIQDVNFYAVAAMGRSKALFWWSFYKWGFLLAAIFIGSNYSVMGIAWGLVASNFNIYFVNALLAGRHVGLSIWRQLKIVAPTIINMAICYAAALLSASCLGWHWTAGAAIFILIYAAGAVTVNRKAMAECRAIVMKIIKR